MDIDALPPVGVRLSLEQREKLAILVGWLKLKNGSEVLRELLEDRFALEAIKRSDFDGPVLFGEGAYQLE